MRFDALNRILGRKEKPQETLLLQISKDILKSKELFKFVVARLSEQSGETPETVERWFREVNDPASSLGLAKKVDQYLGEGTFRKLSFVSSGADAERNLLKILSRDIRSGSFEGQAEKGLYLNIKENYGVEWTLEKAARDILQNFFDGNGQTLDGVNISVLEEKQEKGNKVSIKITGNANYDWRELAHLGGTTKAGSETDAGGFGEGAKILAFIILKNYGAKQIKFSSGDWELDFYLDKVPQGSYRNPDDQGLFLKKRKRNPKNGNALELQFEGDKASEKARAIQDARKLFYSSENPDFRNPSFENKSTGGFSVLAPKEEGLTPRGNVYIAGQRIHYDSRDKWDNIDFVNIWAWKKVTAKDRDRGMVTSEEMRELIIPLIVGSMSTEDLKKSVRDFEVWYEKIGWGNEPNYQLLEAMVNKLAEEGIKMEFKPEFMAGDTYDPKIISFLTEKGYKSCPGVMSKIGMTTTTEQLKKLEENATISQ